MKGFSGYVVGVTLALTLLACSAAASPGIPPPGPIGWEKRITPGFDPPIERVLVYTTRWPHFAVEPQELPKVWGPKALPVLIRLFHAPEWAYCGYDILQLIVSYRTQEAKEMLAAEFLRPETKNPPKQTEEERSLLLRAIGQMDGQAQKEAVATVLQNPDHPAFAATIRVLCDDLYMGAPSAREPLERMLATLPADSPKRSYIEHALKLDRPYRRAEEPMARILEQERKGRP